MTNKERQFRLDEKKWIASEQAGEDMSGKMDYCQNCGKQTAYGCAISQEEREAQSECAVAYNRMRRKK